MVEDKHWTALGACRSASPDDLFVEGAAQRAAREVCALCTVRLECLVDALDSRMGFGVWGGMTERERRALLRRYPEVTSWREQIEAEPGLVSWSNGYRGSHGARRAVDAVQRDPDTRDRAAGRLSAARRTEHEAAQGR